MNLRCDPHRQICRIKLPDLIDSACTRDQIVPVFLHSASNGRHRTHSCYHDFLFHDFLHTPLLSARDMPRHAENAEAEALQLKPHAI